MKRLRAELVVLLVPFVFSAFHLGCGSEEAESSKNASGGSRGGGQGAPLGDSETFELSADEGQVVSSSGARLDLTEGAVAEDTVVTVTSYSTEGLPQANSLTGNAYDFEPDGLQFTEPVTLTLPLEEAAPAGQHAVIAWLDESNDAWVDLPTTVNQDGTVQAEVEHFTLFAVRYAGGAGNEIECSFTPCGGDPVGEWTAVGSCGDIDAYRARVGCPELTITVVGEPSGHASIREDGTFSLTHNLNGSVQLAASNDCFVRNYGATCEELPGCTAASSTDCACSYDPGPSVASGTYEISETSAWFDDGEPETGAMEVPFCVEGSTLTYRTLDSQGTPTIWTLTRD